MGACSFDRLLQFINERLDLDGQLEVYDHLDQCPICRDAVCQLFRERDGAFETAAESPGCVQMIADVLAGMACQA